MVTVGITYNVTVLDYNDWLANVWTVSWIIGKRKEKQLNYPYW